jgi:uncharacterized protein with HEPN domain
MPLPLRDDRDRLQDILDAIKRIKRYGKRGRRVFEEDELVHAWMIHYFQIIGEAARILFRRQQLFFRYNRLTFGIHNNKLSVGPAC